MQNLVIIVIKKRTQALNVHVMNKKLYLLYNF